MELHYQTVSNLLKDALSALMEFESLKSFRLVGGTALSLQIGHRISVDIDLFTDVDYGSVDFELIEQELGQRFSYVTKSSTDLIGFGRSYFIGENEENSIKLDLYYTDPFFTETIVSDGIRMATIDEIVAMKVDVISRGGRKKDFWDLNEVSEKYTFVEMMRLHERRYPYTHDQGQIRRKFVDFEDADSDFDPICLRGNVWELIKLDIEEFVIK